MNKLNTFLTSLVDMPVYLSNTPCKKITNYNNKPNVLTVKDTNYKRLIVMGDIHGMFDKAISALSNANISKDDFVIFLGDYTDRGLQNLECMKLLLAAVKQPNMLPLLGNHELMLVQYFIKSAQLVTDQYYTPNDIDNMSKNQWTKIVDFMKNNDDDIYMYNGGSLTLSEVTFETLPIFKEYLKAIYNLDLSYSLMINNQRYYFAHAGINPFKSLDRQNLEDLVWIREKFYDNYNDDTIITVGHTPTLSLFKDNVPHFYHNIIFADTASFSRHGKVTVMDILNNEYWQNE